MLHVTAVGEVWSALSEGFPLLTPNVEEQVRELIRDRRDIAKLSAFGLKPTTSALFVGPPGVGKTLTARWIAAEARLSVIEITAANAAGPHHMPEHDGIEILKSCRAREALVLIEDFDAFGSGRRDVREIVAGRLVEDWPSNGLVIATSSRPDSLDDASWCRFDAVVRFDQPGPELRREAVRAFSDPRLAAEWIEIVCSLVGDASFSEIRKIVQSICRHSILAELTPDDAARDFARKRLRSLPARDLADMSTQLSTCPVVTARVLKELSLVHTRAKTDR